MVPVFLLGCQGPVTFYAIYYQSDYYYTGTVQTFTAPVDGVYQIQCWGGSGRLNIGGAGAYTSGSLSLKCGQKFYVYVGGTNGATFNRSTSGSGYGGGGATDIRVTGGEWNNYESLKSRIMVAAGGGGAGRDVGRPGGGLTSANGGIHYGGFSAQQFGWIPSATGAGQTYGGMGYWGNEVFSGSYRSGRSGFGTVNGAASMMAGRPIDFWNAGGGGYYGGNMSGANGIWGIATGGSSFISGYPGCNAVNVYGQHTGQPNHYSGFVFNNPVMIAGDGYMPSLNGSGTIKGNTGEGFARIILVEQ